MIIDVDNADDDDVHVIFTQEEVLREVQGRAARPSILSKY